MSDSNDLSRTTWEWLRDCSLLIFLVPLGVVIFAMAYVIGVCWGFILTLCEAARRGFHSGTKGG